jgi:DNA-binding Lrp family transcriptional regulator
MKGKSAGARMEPEDRAILNRIQSGFPLTSRPYALVGEELGMPEWQVLRRVRALKKKGIIRRIGANVFPGEMGYASTLCAGRVPPEKMKGFVRAVNDLPGVTHNYEREHDYNVWFTLIAPSKKAIRESLAKIAAQTGVDEILNLPATKVYKVKAAFTL